jgi:hypothetical protein
LDVHSSTEEVKAQLINVFFDNVPGFLEKEAIKTIKAWGLA